MPLDMEVVLGPGHIVLDGDPALSPRKGPQLVYVVLAHMSTSGLGVGASRASFIAVFVRPLQVMVSCILRDHSPVCPVCNVGVLC